MLDKISHPFIVNTLESSSDWDLVIKRQAYGSGWRACLVLGCTSDENWHEAAHASGKTLSEALDRLESTLSGREHVTKPNPEHEAYLARWKDAPEWAQWLSEDGDGDCAWWEREPFMNDPVNFRVWNLYAGKAKWAKRCLLGAVRCEPRPVL